MKLITLCSIALVASMVVAAPLGTQIRNAATCASTLSGTSAMTCTCLASCTQTKTCCADFDDFQSQLVQFIEPLGIAPPGGLQLPRVIRGRVPPFHKQEPAITGAAPGPNGSTLLTVRHCVFQDQVHIEPPPRPGNGGTTGMPTWVAKECTHGYDVIALSAQGTLTNFDEAVKVPKSVRVALGSPKPLAALPFDARMYFAQLSGTSAAAAYKMALTNERPVAGFTAKLARTQSAGKLAFDETPGRTWRVESASLSTTQVHEMTAPEVDVTAGMLDAAFLRVAKAANFQVVPLRGGLLKMVFDDKKKAWVKVVDDLGRRVVAQSLAA